MGLPKLTFEKFIERARAVHGDKYSYSEYIKASSKLTVTCPIHGSFKQVATSHLQGNGCRKCCFVDISKLRSSNTEEWIRKARLKHGNKYDYSKSEYTGNRNNIEITCPLHGTFYQNAGQHLKHGCDACGIITGADKHKKSEQEFINMVREVHGDKYEYKNFVKMHDYVTCVCKIHGDFKQNASAHSRGQGCPRCNKSTGEERVAAFLSSHNMSFKREETFDGCVGLGGRKLKFDFVLHCSTFLGEDLFIEYDGSQHSSPVGFYGGEEALIKRQKHDQIKDDYACQYGGVMLRIKHTDFDNIETILSGLLCKQND